MQKQYSDIAHLVHQRENDMLSNLKKHKDDVFGQYKNAKDQFAKLEQ